MKKIRIITSIFIAVALLLCLFGCGETLIVEETESLFIAEDVQQYSVYFDGGSGGYGTAPSSITLEAGDSFVVPANTFTKSGYEFYAYWTGWEYVFAGDTYVMKSQDMYFSASWTSVETESSSSGSSGSSSGSSSGGSSGSSSTTSDTSSSSETDTTTTTTTEIVQLDTPSDVEYISGVLSWDTVGDADFYTVYIGDTYSFETAETWLKMDILSENSAEGISVVANTNDSDSYSDSDASETVSVSSVEISDGVIVANGDLLIVVGEYVLDGNLQIQSESEVLYLVGGSLVLTGEDSDGDDGDVLVVLSDNNGDSIGDTVDGDTVDEDVCEAGDLTIYAPNASFYQEISISISGTLYLTVSSETYIQNSTLSAGAVEILSGKLLQNSEITTESVDVTRESAYFKITEETNATSIPTLVIADGESIDIGVNLPLTLEIVIDVDDSIDDGVVDSGDGSGDGDTGDGLDDSVVEVIVTQIDLSNVASSSIEIIGDTPDSIIIAEALGTAITNSTGSQLTVVSGEYTCDLPDSEILIINFENFQTNLVWGGYIGTAFADLNVTTTVAGWYSANEIAYLDVDWDSDSYDSSLSSQTIYGAVEVDGVEESISLTILLVEEETQSGNNNNSGKPGSVTTVVETNYAISSEIVIPDIIGTTYQAGDTENEGIIDLSDSYLLNGDSNFIWMFEKSSISATVVEDIAIGTATIYGYFSEDSDYVSCTISEDLTGYTYNSEEGRIEIEIEVSHDLSALSYTPPENMAGATNYAFNSLVLIDKEYTVDNSTFTYTYGGKTYSVDTVGTAFENDGYVAYQELYISLVEAFEAMHYGTALSTANLADFVIVTDAENGSFDIEMQSLTSDGETYYYLNFYIDPDYYTGYEVNMVIELIRLDHTRFYWLNNYCVSISSQNMGSTTTLGYATCVFAEFFDDSNEYYSIANMDELLAEQVEYFKSLTEYCLTDLEKVALVHSAMLGMVEYDGDVVTNGEYTYTSNNIIGILDENSATDTVCEGYAMAFSYIMNELGVNTLSVIGTCSSSSVSGHAWNMFEIDGVWYWLDLTWNDDEDLKDSSNAFLGLSDSAFVDGGKIEWLDSDIEDLNISSCHISYGSTIIYNSVLYICYDLPNVGSSLTLFNDEYIMLSSGQLLFTAEITEDTTQDASLYSSQDVYGAFATPANSTLSDLSTPTLQGGVRFINEEIVLIVE